MSSLLSTPGTRRSPAGDAAEGSATVYERIVDWCNEGPLDAWAALGFALLVVVCAAISVIPGLGPDKAWSVLINSFLVIEGLWSLSVLAFIVVADIQDGDWIRGAIHLVGWICYFLLCAAMVYLIYRQGGHIVGNAGRGIAVICALPFLVIWAIVRSVKWAWLALTTERLPDPDKPLIPRHHFLTDAEFRREMDSRGSGL